MAAPNYAACLKEVLKHEGGYVNHPKDPGGETNYGITKATAKAHGYTGSMRAIPMTVVEAIYRKSYWNTPGYKCDTLAAGVDLATFDFGVNSGPARAATYLKSAVGGTAVQTVKKLCAARMGFLKRLGTWGTFGKGWTRRVAQVEAVGVKMALAGEGKAPAEVKKDMEAESTAAAAKRNAQAGGAVAAPTAPAVEHSTAAPDASLFDLSTALGIALAVAVVAVGAWLAYRAYVNHTRAQAFAEAAKEPAP